MICSIVAVEQNQGIGFQGSMPWPRLDGDMNWFKERTTNNVVVMGSNTYRSIGKTLPNRVNAVISSKMHVGALTFGDPVEAVKELSSRYSKKDIFVIGGQSVYESLRDLVEVFYVTEIQAGYVCDKFFDLDYVKKNYPTVTELSSFEATATTPAYTINEYKK
jgi:dihydrofolate reductase